MSDAAPPVRLRWLFVAGYALVGAAALVGLALAAPSALVPAQLDILLASGGITLVALALANGFASPFTKREILAPAWAPLVPLALVVVAAALAFVLHLAGRDGMPLAWRVTGAALLWGALHLGASAAWGAPWRGGIALFAKDQPFRGGDQVAAAFFASALVMLAASGALLLGLPRGLPFAGLALLHAGFALPFFAGALVFLLPRNAKRPLQGPTLPIAALVLSVGSALALAFALAFVFRSGLRVAATGALVATGLFLFAAWRMRADTPGPVLARARGVLRGAAALAVLSGIALLLALAGDAPGPLFPAAGYAALATDGALAVGVTLLGAPILLNAVPRGAGWFAWASAVAVAGLFLLAPAFEFAGRGAFPGAVVLAMAVGLALWGLEPLRTPRRDC